MHSLSVSSCFGSDHAPAVDRVDYHTLSGRSSASNIVQVAVNLPASSATTTGA